LGFEDGFEQIGLRTWEKREIGKPGPLAVLLGSGIEVQEGINAEVAEGIEKREEE
jgi:hypothetical protein